MREFFHGWRPKAGCVTLVMTCALMGAWVRSLTVEDVAFIQGYEAGSASGRIWLVEKPGMDIWSWNSRTIQKGQSNEVMKYWWFENGYWAIPYWPIAIPLTLLSAYLILWKPRKRTEPDNA